MFHRIETLIGAGMPAGYSFLPRPNDVASVVLGKSTWSVLALTCLIELFTQAHYRASIEPDSELSPLFKDVFLFHWKEESQHAILDELEWVRENAKLTAQARDAAVDDVIVLVGAVDGILQAQSAADTHYFVEICGRPMTAAEVGAVKATVLAAYRWQYIVSGVQIPRFGELLYGMITPAQGERSAPRSRRSWPDKRGDPLIIETTCLIESDVAGLRAGPCNLRPWRARLSGDFHFTAARATRPTAAYHGLTFCILSADPARSARRGTARAGGKKRPQTETIERPLCVRP